MAKQVEIRLHREFFDLIKDVEYVFKYRANITERISQPLIEEAITAYRSNGGTQSFREYLIDVLKQHPIVYSAIPDSALADLSGDPGAAVAREAWRTSRLQTG